MRIIHAHDQCGVAKSLVRIGRLHKEAWFRVPRFLEFKKFPPGFVYIYGVFAEVLARSAAISTASLIHIHGGHLHKFAARSEKDYFLHIHGSEVRTFDERGTPFKSISPGTVTAILNAKTVFYSTPDLGPYVRDIRGDALWLPNPVEKFAIPKNSSPFPFADVYFPHAWNNSKGIRDVLEVLRVLQIREGRKLRVIGLQLGEFQSDAVEAGITLVKPANRSTHIQRMLESKVVLGQAGGYLDLTALEGLAHGANYILFPLEETTLSAYGLDKNTQPSPTFDSVIEDCQNVLLSPANRRQPSSVQRILTKHSDENIYKTLKSAYSSAAR